MSISVFIIDDDPEALEKLLSAIREAHHGGTPRNSQTARKIVEFHQQPPPSASQQANLTQRQAQVLDLLAQGCSYHEIARLTQLTYATVHTHIRHLYKKLQVKSRSQAVAKLMGQNRRQAPTESVKELADTERPLEESAWPASVAEVAL
jgi:DNA-binding NarL/FixJ family response regulator